MVSDSRFWACHCYYRHDGNDQSRWYDLQRTVSSWGGWSAGSLLDQSPRESWISTRQFCRLASLVTESLRPCLLERTTACRDVTVAWVFRALLAWCSGSVTNLRMASLGSEISSFREVSWGTTVPSSGSFTAWATETSKLCCCSLRALLTPLKMAASRSFLDIKEISFSFFFALSFGCFYLMWMSF